MLTDQEDQTNLKKMELVFMVTFICLLQRYVNDKDTYGSFHLSKKYKSNVLNFGVGNYGIDQAFLKVLENRKKKSRQKLYFVLFLRPLLEFFLIGNILENSKIFLRLKPIFNFEGAQLEIIRFT